MISREQALNFLHAHMENRNLRRHCYAVEAVMRALARHFSAKGEEEKWGIVGLLHDADYEMTKDKPEKHTLMTVAWLKELGETDEEITRAISSHNYSRTGKMPPKTKLEWSLYCCDELTGFIVAVTLVHPDKRLASITVDSILKKWDQKSFASGVKREQIEECEPRLEIPLKEFIQIALGAMQSIAEDLGL